MGWHYTLTLKCKIKPEYIDFISGRYLYDLCDDTEEETTHDQLPKSYRDLIDIWKHTHIGQYFYAYDLHTDGIFTCEISKKVNAHHGDLRDAYVEFLKDIIVHISSVILECKIESDDYGDACWHYTDSDLRNTPFRLQDKIKIVEHTYSADGREILESRIVYKHSVPTHQHLDLARTYGIRN